LYAGWKGFFARGKEPTITVDGLEQVRSTWNAAEQGSEVPVIAWALTGDFSRSLPAAMKPFLLGGRHSLMDWPPRPSPRLFPRTIDASPDQMSPVVSAWAVNHASRNLGVGPPPNKLMAYDPELARMASLGAADLNRAGGGGVAGVGPSALATPELTMNTDDP